MKLKQLKILLAIPLILLGCAKDSNKSTPTYTPPVTLTYTIVNGQCMGSNGVVAPSVSYCQGVVNSSGYYTGADGRCYHNSNPSLAVQTQLCQTTTNTGGVASEMCNGVYYYQGTYGAWQAIYCSGNCSGYTLARASQTGQGQWVRCL